MPNNLIIRKLIYITILVISSCDILKGRDVDMDLLLLIDSSGSIDENESRLQFHGYAEAFRNKGIIDEILKGSNKSIAVSVLLFSDNTVKLIDWTIIDSYESALNFASEIEKAPRIAGGTFIVNAVRDAIIEFSNCPYKSQSLTIDISGDGPDNQFDMPTLPMNPIDFINNIFGNQTQLYNNSKIVNDFNLKMVRDQANDYGIEINCLAIEDPMMKLYYENNIMCGHSSFTFYVRNFVEFSQSINRKILTEISHGIEKTRNMMSEINQSKVISNLNEDSNITDKNKTNFSKPYSSMVIPTKKIDFKAEAFLKKNSSIEVFVSDDILNIPINNVVVKSDAPESLINFEKSSMPGHYVLKYDLSLPPVYINIHAPGFQDARESYSDIIRRNGIIKLKKKESQMSW